MPVWSPPGGTKVSAREPGSLLEMQAGSSPSSGPADRTHVPVEEYDAARRAAVAATEELTRYRVRSEALLRQRDAELTELREQLLALRTQRIDEGGSAALPLEYPKPAPAAPTPAADDASSAEQAKTIEALNTRVTQLRAQVQKLSKWRVAAKEREAVLKQEREQMSRALEMLAEEVTTWESRWKDALASGVISSGPTPAEKVAEKFAAGAGAAAGAVGGGKPPSGAKKGASMSSPPGPAPRQAPASSVSSPPTFLLASVAAEAVSSLSRLLPAAANDGGDKDAETGDAAGSSAAGGGGGATGADSVGSSQQQPQGSSSAQTLIRSVLARAGSALGAPLPGPADDEDDGSGSDTREGGRGGAAGSHAPISASLRAREEAATESLQAALRASELDSTRLKEEYALYRRRVADTTREKEEAIAALQDELSSMRAKLRALKLASGLSSSSATLGGGAGGGGRDAPPLLDAARWAYLRDLLIKYLNAEATIRGQLEPAIAVVIGYKQPRKAGGFAGITGASSGSGVMATATEGLTSLLTAVGSGIFGIAASPVPTRHPDPSTLVAVPWSAAGGGGSVANSRPAAALQPLSSHSGGGAIVSIPSSAAAVAAPASASSVVASGTSLVSSAVSSLSSWWGGSR